MYVCILVKIMDLGPLSSLFVTCLYVISSTVPSSDYYFSVKLLTTTMYGVAVWIGYYWLLLYIRYFCIVSKFMNFQVEKCMEIMPCSMEIQKYRYSLMNRMSVNISTNSIVHYNTCSLTPKNSLHHVIIINSY